MERFKDIHAITFDVGNTLLKTYPSVGAVMSGVLRRHGWKVPAENLDSSMDIFDRYYAQEYERDESLWSEEARQRAMWINGFAQVCRAVGIDRDLDTIAQACYNEFDNAQHWQLFEGAEATLAELKRRGFVLGVISNWGAGLEQLLGDIGIGQYFEVVTASAAAGVHKPMPEAFVRTLDALGVVPQHALHVGDHPTADIEGARAAGMHALLVQLGGREDATVGDRVPDGVAVITALPQLLGLL